jgi:hypothetical protein
MLIGVSHEVIKGVTIRLVFDDGTVKTNTVYVNDTVDVYYSKDGTRRHIEGRVTKVEELPNHAGHVGHIASCGNCKNTGCYITVDGSEESRACVAKIDVDCILDLDVLQHAGENDCITSPKGEYNVNQFRLVGKCLQLSCDFGQHWMVVCTLPDEQVIVPEEDQDIADKISALIPSCANPCQKAELVKALVDLFNSELPDSNPDDINGE